jgi:hypothetical protein
VGAEAVDVRERGPQTQATSAATLPARLSIEAKARLQALTPSQRFEKGGYAIVTHRIQRIHNKVSGHAQMILIEEIIHETFGKKGNPEWAQISLRGLAEKSRYGRKAYQLALDDAVDRGLVERKKGGKFWYVKTVPEDWDSVPDYVSAPPPELMLIEGGRQHDPVTGRFTIGENQILAMRDLPVEDPAGCRFQRVMKTPLPLDVSLDVHASGLVSVVVSDAVSASSSLAKTPQQEPTVLLLFACELAPIFLQQFNKVPDPALLSEIVQLCGGAHPQMLVERIEQKIKAGKLKSSGLVLELARDVGNAWRAREQLRVAAEQEQAERERRRPPPHVPTAEELEAEAAQVERDAQARREAAERCQGCNGSGNVDSGITNVKRRCGLCAGLGKKPSKT